MILARHAEALFWAGRYLERAETTARMLAVTTRAAMHVEPPAAAATWKVLVDSLHLSVAFSSSDTGTPPRYEERSVAGFLLSDPDTPGSIRQSITMLRDNLRTARERVPVELWEETSRLHLHLSSQDMAKVIDGEPHELYQRVRQGCQAISGVIAEAMTRDEGHAFLVMGRMIERSLLTVQLLQSTLDTSVAQFDPDRVLRSTSSMQAFHRIHGHGATHLGVMLFLLESPSVPRSVLSCTENLADRLSSLGDAENVARPQQLVGRLRSRLQFQQVEEEIHVDAARALDGVRNDILQIAESITAQLFHSAVQPLPTSQFVRPGSGSA